MWFEATTRRKIDFSQLPYLLETKKKKGMQKEELNAENADIFETQEEVSQENADISRQTKLKETKLNSEEEEIARNHICSNNSDATVVVVDATCTAADVAEFERLSNINASMLRHLTLRK